MKDRDQILNRYYSGETSLEEEKLLRKLIAGKKPHEILPDEILIEAMNDFPDFRAMAEKAMDELPSRKTKFLSVRLLHRVAAAAVTVLIAVSATITLRHNATPHFPAQELTLAEATEQTRKALLLFANTVNRSRESIAQAEMTLTAEINDKNISK